jgi:uncharacterized protein YbjT (DUF2867 family)
MATTLILGATGNLGGLTADRLHRTAPGDLRVATSRASGLRRLERRFPAAEAIVCDWNDEAGLTAAMDGVGKVLMVTPDFVTDEAVVTGNLVAGAAKTGTVELIVRLLGMPPGFTPEQADPEYVETRAGAGLHVVAKPLLDASGLPVCYVNVPAWIMFNLASFVAVEVKPHRRIAMPASTDSPRMWVSENDIADVFARILSEPAAAHAGREYVLTSPDRYGYADLARAFSDVLGETVTYADDPEPLRLAMGESYELLMTYLRHETGTYAGVRHEKTITELLGRPQETLHDYLDANQELFR